MRVFLFGLIACASMTHASEADIHTALTDALLCKGDPAAAVLGAVRALAEKGSNFDRGYATAQFGEEMGEVDVAILREPLEVAGAQTGAVVLTFTNFYSGFNGIVYAKFKGDFHKTVEQLGLSPTHDEDAIGKYIKPIFADSPSPDCPPTIAVTPLESGEFLLGCGWCNG